MNSKLLFPIFCMLLLFACEPDSSILETEEKPTLPSTVAQYDQVMMPAHFSFMSVNGSTGEVSTEGTSPIPLNALDDITNEKATLGRVLFYDKKLSLTNRVSCGSCHDQKAGFADSKAFSDGFNGQKTKRNSMALANSVYNNSFFWDSRTPDLNTLILQPVVDHIEMGMEELDKLNLKLENTSYYGELFENAFGDDQISSVRISEAIATFVNSMVSKDSKFDEGVATNFENFSAIELAGKDLFFSARTKCGTCHSGANFIANTGFAEIAVGLIHFSEEDMNAHPSLRDVFPGEYNQTVGTANIGLDKQYADQGRNDGKFKIPSLRNIAVTGPYMHDGRFATLEDVIDHYDQNIQPHTHLDDKFLSAGSANPQSLNLNENEKQALVAFLNTLTDDSLLTDDKFSNPF